jgi:two-component system CheB/CheR fusion protein
MVGGTSVNFSDVTRSRRFKEELEHANQGLEDAYDELGRRTTELNQLNAFLESIWAGLDGAVTVLDADLRVLV